MAVRALLVMRVAVEMPARRRAQPAWWLVELWTKLRVLLRVELWAELWAELRQALPLLLPLTALQVQ